jgi:hypothetical protein
MDNDLEQLQERYKEAKSVQDLLAMPGWKIVEAQLRTGVSVLKDALSTEESFKRMRIFQERIRAASVILDVVYSIAQESVSLADLLSKITEDNNNREQDGLN